MSSNAPGAHAAPSPALLFDTINAYQRTAAIKAAIELDVFTALADSPGTAAAIAAHCHASQRGVRILCDYLTVQGFLTKAGDHYSLTPDSALFLNRKSRAYAGGTIEFLLSPDLRGSFDTLTNAVRKGGTARSAEGTIAPEHPVWLAFAHSMTPIMAPGGANLAELVRINPTRPAKVLDISASHGMWGIGVAQRYPNTELVALDWAPVLEIARQNATACGVGDRFSTIAGSAFDVDFGDSYDAVLLPNFLHHFNPADCVRLLKKTHAALRPGGSVVIVEFVPNSDRVSPHGPAGFAIVMLATTPEGDAYTLAEYSEMLALAGFGPALQYDIPASINTAIIATKPA